MAPKHLIIRTHFLGNIGKGRKKPDKPLRKQEKMYVDYMQVRNAEVLVYQYWQGIRKAANKRGHNPFLGINTYSGTVTSSTGKRMKKAISLMIQKSPRKWIYNPVSRTKHAFRINFVTLTIADSKQATAKEIYSNCMAPWLRWARGAGMTDYVWKAELQQRGEVHYHIATNVFLHWEDIRDVWNKHQKKAGYLDNYAKKFGHFKPNSTDVHVTKRVREIERYLTKYMMKGVGTAAIAGKVWDCSANLKAAKYFTTEITPFNVRQLRSIAKREIINEYCTIYQIPQDSAKAVMDNVQRVEYQNHLAAI